MTSPDYVAAPHSDWVYTKPKHGSAKTLLLTIGGVAITGQWSGEIGQYFLAWAPLPKRDKALEKMMLDGRHVRPLNGPRPEMQQEFQHPFESVYAVAERVTRVWIQHLEDRLPKRRWIDRASSEIACASWNDALEKAKAQGVSFVIMTQAKRSQLFTKFDLERRCTQSS